MNHKFAIIGTSCSGKTTLTHALVSRLKSYGYLVDGVYSQDRKFSFPISKIETEAAQNWMIANMIAKEADLSLHDDVDILISDRSPLDLMAYYKHQFATDLSDKALAYAMEWCKGYTAMYYLTPLPYQDDSKRPPDDFRLDVDRKLQELLTKASAKGVNLVQIDRRDVLTDLMKKAHLTKPDVKTVMTTQDAQLLANFLARDVVVKLSKDTDILSDNDIWIIDKPRWSTDTQPRWDQLLRGASQWVKNTCGPWVTVDINITHDPSTLDPSWQTFCPEVPA